MTSVAIKKMKFGASVDAVIEKMESLLQDSKYNYSITGREICIFNVPEKKDESVVGICLDTVKEIIPCENAKIHCKISKYKGNVYIRFKKKIGV